MLSIIPVNRFATESDLSSFAVYYISCLVLNSLMYIILSLLHIHSCCHIFDILLFFGLPYLRCLYPGERLIFSSVLIPGDRYFCIYRVVNEPSSFINLWATWQICHSSPCAVPKLHSYGISHKFSHLFSHTGIPPCLLAFA